MKISHSSQSSTNTRSLSGGERSYTTICFLKALWSVAQCPFRILDEFDVFMVSTDTSHVRVWGGGVRVCGACGRVYMWVWPGVSSHVRTYTFLGAAAGSPYIVFISTSGM